MKCIYYRLPVTVEEAVGCGSVRVLVVSNENPEDCVLSKKSDDNYSLSNYELPHESKKKIITYFDSILLHTHNL